MTALPLLRSLPMLFLLSVLLGIVFLSGAGCRGGGYESLLPSVDSSDTRSKPILQLAREDGRADAFLSAMQAAGLTEPLSDLGPWTLFAPTDAALRSAGHRVDTLFNPSLQDSLSKLLSYHIVRGRVDTSAVGDSLRIATLFDDEPLVLRYGADSVLYVNQAPVLGRIPGQNGTLFFLGAVLHLPPPDTFVTESVLFGR